MLKFWRTKIITFAPRYLLINKMNKSLLFQEIGITKKIIINSEKIIPYHCNTKQRLFSISIEQDNIEQSNWSW